MNIKKKLSICADDFGMTEKISDAIFKLIDAERVTETSCIVLSGAFHNRAKKLSKYQNRIGIGLHLTLTDFVPLSNLKSLSVGGKLGNIKSLLIKSINKNYSKNEIIEEINMQLDLFQKLLGFSPDFIDGHHHVHQLPIIREALIEIIKKRYSDRLPWIRNTSEDMFKIYKRKISIIKSISLSIMGKKIKKLAKTNSIKSNDGFSGIYDFSAEKSYENIFKSFIKNISNNHLIMVHPGECDEILSSMDSVTITRDNEYEFLISDNFIKALNSFDIKLKPLFS